MRLPWLVLPLLALAVGGCSGGTKTGAGAQHTVVLTIANHETESRELTEYIAAVNRLSDGSIKLESRADWRFHDLAYDRGTLADVRAGKVDLAKIATGSLDRLGVDDFQAMMAPLLVDGLALEQKVLASRLPDEMLPGIRRLGVEGLAMLPGEPRRPFGLTRRLIEPSDYRDAVIGIRPSLLSATTFRALGATPRSYLPGELPPWLFDGADLDLFTLEANQYDAPGSSITTNVSLWSEPFIVVANPDLLAKLTAEQREILRSAGREALGPAIARLRNESRVATDTLCRRGLIDFVAATPSQLAALRASARPVYAELGHNPQARAFIDEIEALKRGSPPERAVACSAPPLPPQRAATLLDGTWEMTASRARAGEVDAGHYRMILRRGRLVAVSPWRSTGTFRIRGDTVIFRSADGEFGVYRWNLYRETLTLAYVPGKEEGAPNPTFAPWHRVGG
jgi:TRAP-type C4-dicarboxylate transport system substrate-binding protein